MEKSRASDRKLNLLAMLFEPESIGAVVVAAFYCDYILYSVHCLSIDI